MTQTKTSTLAFISLQTCFQNFQLNQKSRGGDCPPRPPVFYAYVHIPGIHVTAADGLQRELV